MLNKSEITRLLKSQEERERENKRRLKWYFWNLRQYRNGGVICPKCTLIIPKDKNVEFNFLTGTYLYTCTGCYCKFSIRKFGLFGKHPRKI